MTTVVIAGNHREYEHWLREQGIDPRSREYVYVNRPDCRLDGLRIDRVERIGTWYKLPHLDRLAAHIRARLTKEATDAVDAG